MYNSNEYVLLQRFVVTSPVDKISGTFSYVFVGLYTIVDVNHNLRQGTGRFTEGGMRI